MHSSFGHLSPFTVRLPYWSGHLGSFHVGEHLLDLGFELTQCSERRGDLIASVEVLRERPIHELELALELTLLNPVERRQMSRLLCYTIPYKLGGQRRWWRRWSGASAMLGLPLLDLVPSWTTVGRLRGGG